MSAKRSLYRLSSIKSRILAFALLATLIPALTLGWLSYRLAKRSLADKVSEAVRDASQHVARELDLWLKERLYEIKVFANSYVVLEGLERSGTDPTRTDQEALRHLTDYLRFVQTKFPEYQELLIVGPDGRVVATSLDRASAVSLPDNWPGKARSGDPIVGLVRRDESLRTGVVVLAEPVLAADQRVLGLLAAKVGLRPIDGVLRRSTSPSIDELYLLAPGGAVIAGARPGPTACAHTNLPRDLTTALFQHEQVVQSFRDDCGVDVIGTLRAVPLLNLGVVADVERASAYLQVYRLRNVTLAFVGALLVGIGVIAYLLGLTIVRPLDRLVDGAAAVARGDLDIDLPRSSRGEVGYLTEVFNDMVRRLRDGRRELDEINQTLRERNLELQQLSITDSLTGLHNRKHLMELLALELGRVARYSTPLAVLMADIDSFKQYNDTFGHLAGDEVLRRIAAIFRASLRSSDVVGRYGGEEFVFALPSTDTAAGLETAERLRHAVAQEVFPGASSVSITLSIGVTVVREGEIDLTEVLGRADAALYRAKQCGRNRVVNLDFVA